MTKKTTTTAQEAPDRIFEVRKSADKNWHWHAKSPANGDITFQGQRHPNEGNALRAINQEMHALGSTKEMHIHVYNKHDATEPSKTLVRKVEAPRLPGLQEAVAASKERNAVPSTAKIANAFNEATGAPKARKIDGATPKPETISSADGTKKLTVHRQFARNSSTKKA